MKLSARTPSDFRKASCKNAPTSVAVKSSRASASEILGAVDKSFVNFNIFIMLLQLL
jgi:hypothetical protein